MPRVAKRERISWMCFLELRPRTASETRIYVVLRRTIVEWNHDGRTSKGLQMKIVESASSDHYNFVAIEATGQYGMMQTTVSGAPNRCGMDYDAPEETSNVHCIDG